jgi:gas vesicle protein
MDTGRFLFGIAIGAAAGALAGILLAPEKGSETRRKLIEKGDSYSKNLKNRFNNLTNSLRNKGQEYAPENEFREATSPSI